MKNPSNYVRDDNAREKKEMRYMARELLAELGHPLRTPVKEDEENEDFYSEINAPFDDMESNIVQNPHDNISDDNLRKFDDAFESGQSVSEFKENSGNSTFNLINELGSNMTEDYYEPDIPYEDMENDIAQNLYSDRSDNEIISIDEAFEKDEDVSSSERTNETIQSERSSSADENFSNVVMQDSNSISNEDINTKKTSAKVEKTKYIDNGFLPMQLAERFIAKNPMFKLNGGRMYMYGFNGSYCYSEISEEQLSDVVFRFFKDRFMNETPGFVVQVTKSVRIQLECVSKDTIRKYESRYVACRNVIIDLENDRLIPHTPDILLRYYLDVDVDFNNRNCPVFDQLIEDMACGREDVVKAIHQMIAYCTFPTDFKKAFFVMIGPPNSSKSLLGNLIQSLYSANAVCNECLQDLGKNFRSGNYAEARLNFDGDLPCTPINPKEVGILKKILGGERIMSEAKYQQSYATDTDCKFLFASNFKLMLKSPDSAFLFRLHVIPCDNVVDAEEMDLLLPEKLKDEKTAIFTKIYKWYKDLKKSNYKFCDCVSNEEYCKTYVKDEFSQVSFVLDDFMKDCFEVTGESTDFVSTETIKQVFVWYSKQKMIDIRIPGFEQRFSSFIKENFSDSVYNTRHGRDKTRGYAGIILCVDPINYSNNSPS